jgi:hypothetical protein
VSKFPNLLKINQQINKLIKLKFKITAGRIFKGQLKGNNGEEEVTYMESLPHLALSKVIFEKKKQKAHVE